MALSFLRHCDFSLVHFLLKPQRGHQTHYTHFSWGIKTHSGSYLGSLRTTISALSQMSASWSLPPKSQLSAHHRGGRLGAKRSSNPQLGFTFAWYQQRRLGPPPRAGTVSQHGYDHQLCSLRDLESDWGKWQSITIPPFQHRKGEVITVPPCRGLRLNWEKFMSKTSHSTLHQKELNKKQIIFLSTFISQVLISVFGAHHHQY